MGAHRPLPAQPGPASPLWVPPPAGQEQRGSPRGLGRCVVPPAPRMIRHKTRPASRKQTQSRAAQRRSRASPPTAPHGSGETGAKHGEGRAGFGAAGGPGEPGAAAPTHTWLAPRLLPRRSIPWPQRARGQQPKALAGSAVPKIITIITIIMQSCKARQPS